MSCRRFKSRSTGNTNCAHCGCGFYIHSVQSRMGHEYFQPWRQDNMTDQELLEWFMSLGADRDARIKVCRTLLTDPNAMLTPAPNKINPSMKLIGAMLEALTGEHVVKGKTQEMPSPSDNDGKGTAILEPAKLHTCYGCGETTAETEGDVCAECEAFYIRDGAQMGKGPAIRIEVKEE